MGIKLISLRKTLAVVVTAVLALPVLVMSASPQDGVERCPFVVRMTVGTTQPTAPVFVSLRDRQGVVAQGVSLDAHGRDLHGLGPSDRPAYGQIWITHTDGTITGNSAETYRLDGELTTATVTGVDIVGHVEWLLVTHDLHRPELPVEPVLRAEPQNPSERIPQMPAWKNPSGSESDFGSPAYWAKWWDYRVPHRTSAHREEYVDEAALWRTSLASVIFAMPNSVWNTGNNRIPPQAQESDRATWPAGMENLVKRIDAFWVYADRYPIEHDIWSAEKLQYDADSEAYRGDVADYQRLVALLATSKGYYKQFGTDNEAHRIHSGYGANGFRHPPDGANQTGWWRDASGGPATVTVDFDHPRCADAVIPIDKALALETNPVTLAAFDRGGYRPVYVPPAPEEPAMETTPGSIEDKLDLILERMESLESRLARIEAKLDEP